jgi:hypothetical protein
MMTGWTIDAYGYHVIHGRECSIWIGARPSY